MHIITLNDVTMVYLNSFREVNKRMARSINITDSEYLQHRHASHSHFDRLISNDSKSFDDAITDLLGMEEIKLLENASRAVGERGVIGRDTPAVMPFYIFALRISQLLDSYSTLQNSITIEEADKNDMSVRREKRFWNIVKNVVKYLDSNCPRPINPPYCKGLCGRGCDCWWWVCGNCCWNRACYWHDDCCHRRGLNHPRCIFALDVFFHCDRYYSC